MSKSEPPTDHAARLQRLGIKRVPHEEPTYGCHECQDRGVVIFERKSRYGYQTAYSRPCGACVYGEEMERAFASWRSEGRTRGLRQDRAPNRRLEWVRPGDKASDSEAGQELDEGEPRRTPLGERPDWWS
jgi:hypothetical protein